MLENLPNLENFIENLFSIHLTVKHRLALSRHTVRNFQSYRCRSTREGEDDNETTLHALTLAYNEERLTDNDEIMRS